MSGSVGHAQSGRLSFMVGGNEQTLEEVKPILLAIGEKITRVGDPGDGKLMKLATNLQVYDPYGRFVYFEVEKKF